MRKNNPTLGWTIIGIFAVGAWLASHLFGWVALGTYAMCCAIALLLLRRKSNA